MKCSDTVAGLRSVSTTIPPSTICATIPAGCAAASQTRSGRRRAPGPPARNRHAAISTATATTVTTTVTIRLPNSIQVWNMGSPRVGAATRLLRVHCGQSGQPSPDLLSRTAAPVTMMTAVEITPASAILRMETGVGSQTAAAQRRATDPGPGAGRERAPPGHPAAGWGRLARPHGRSGPPRLHPGWRLQACGAWDDRALPRAAPAQATITQTIAAHSLTASASPSMTRPTRAATAGSRLIQMPNTLAGTRRRASSSSV